jgi:transcriptional regulator with XRE-family HTH domain
MPKTFPEWESEQMQSQEFVEAVAELEPGYQIARLRIAQGLTQAQLAEKVGTKQPSIARIESGKDVPSLSFLQKVASALNAKVEIRVTPR